MTKSWPCLIADADFSQNTSVVSVINGPLKKTATNPRYFTDNSGQAIYLSGLIKRVTSQCEFIKTYIYLLCQMALRYIPVTQLWSYSISD